MRSRNTPCTDHLLLPPTWLVVDGMGLVAHVGQAVAQLGTRLGLSLPIVGHPLGAPFDRALVSLAKGDFEISPSTASLPVHLRAFKWREGSIVVEVLRAAPTAHAAKPLTVPPPRTPQVEAELQAIAHDIRASLAGLVFNLADARSTYELRGGLSEELRREIRESASAIRTTFASHHALRPVDPEVSGLSPLPRPARQPKLARPHQPAEATDSATILERAVSTLRRVAQARMIDIRVERSAALPLPSEVADITTRCLVTLINNAIEAIGREGMITVHCHRRTAASACTFIVQDTGPGVPETLRDAIFEPFMTTKVTGSGIGLPTAKGLLRRVGGDLELRSSTQGARFALTVPTTMFAGAQPSSGVQVKGHSSSSPPGRKPKAGGGGSAR